MESFKNYILSFNLNDIYLLTKYYNIDVPFSDIPQVLLNMFSHKISAQMDDCVKQNVTKLRSGSYKSMAMKGNDKQLIGYTMSKGKYTDENINCWLVDIPYYFVSGETVDECKRYYFVHENTIVYTDDKEGELYTFLKDTEQRDIYLISNKNCRNLFMVMNPYYPFINTQFRMNGAPLYTPKRVYEYLWSISIKKNSFCSNFRVNLFNKIETIPFHIIKSTCVPHKLSQEFEIPKKYIDIAKSINYKEYCEFNGQYPQYKKSVINFTPELTFDFPQKKYKPPKFGEIKNIHWGQVKLLLSEIEFLSDITNRPLLVVYAGAAGGQHIPILSSLFPDILFILYDPSKFDIKPTPNIVIRNELFLDSNAKLYKHFSAVFISDIRIVKSGKVEEQQIIIDNKWQMDWVKIMDPLKSILKFRTPWLSDPDHIISLYGKQQFQAFAPAHSSEIRLISQRPYVEKKYMNKTHDDQMYYFNNEYRNKNFHREDCFFGVNYDTLRTANILKKYIENVSKFTFEFSVNIIIMALILYIENKLGKYKISKLLIGQINAQDIAGDITGDITGDIRGDITGDIPR